MTSLWDLWLTTAARCPNHIAVIDADTGRKWTRQELTGLAERIAAPLDDRVLPVCQPNSAFWLASFLAIQKIRSAVLPLEPSLPLEAQSKIVRRVLTHPLRNICCVKLTSGTTGD